MSQRALGLLFDPPVTTQFISNVERGVTPLPPAHIQTLTRALMVTESEMMSMLEREYTAKLSDRCRVASEEISLEPPSATGETHPKSLAIDPADLDFMRQLYDSYRQADIKARQAFQTVCESILKLPKPR